MTDLIQERKFEFIYIYRQTHTHTQYSQVYLKLIKLTYYQKINGEKKVTSLGFEPATLTATRICSDKTVIYSVHITNYK